MANENDIKLAKSTFATLCASLDKNDWKYAKDEEKLMLSCTARGDDLPMSFTVSVSSEMMLVLLISSLPFDIPDDKVFDVAIAITAVNQMLVEGGFDFDISSKSLFFRLTTSFIESQMGEEMFIYMLYKASTTVDMYNDRLLMLIKGNITLEQFISQIGE